MAAATPRTVGSSVSHASARLVPTPPTAAQDPPPPQLPLVRLIHLAAQVLAPHLLAAVLAEMVFASEAATAAASPPGEGKHFSFVCIYGATEFSVFAAVPLLGRLLLEGPVAAARLLQPGKGYVAMFALCGVAMALSHGAGLAVNVRFNYTTAMVFSSARLPSILIFGPLVNRAGCAPPSAHVAGLLVMVGLVFFSLGECKESARFEMSGLIYLAVNFIGGSLVFNLQERLLKVRRRHLGEGSKASSAEQLMVLQYAAGACVFLLIACVNGEMAAFPRWCTGHHRGFIGMQSQMLLGAALSAVGVRALIRITDEFDAARASAVTSVRKVCTFAISYLLFPKVFTRLHALGSVLALCGSFWMHRVLERKRGKRGESKAQLIAKRPTVTGLRPGDAQNAGDGRSRPVAAAV